MNSLIKVSVIVPVYNVEDYIPRFLDALRVQSLEDAEFIFVDDASGDGSMLSVETCAEQDPRVRIVRNPANLGQGAARNEGIRHARGEYLSFMDPDDWPEENFLEILYQEAKEKDLDIVKGRIRYRQSDGNEVPHNEVNDVIRENIDRTPLYRLFNYQMQSAIYRRSLVESEGIEFGLPRKDQDTTFLVKVCYYADSFGLADEAVYNYCEREGSIMQNIGTAILSGQFASFKDQTSFLSEHAPDDIYTVMYTISKGNQFLSMQSYVAHYCDDGKSAADALKEFRSYMMGLPFRDRLLLLSAPMHALAVTGENLCAYPYSLPWHAAEPLQWLRLASDWVDFAGRHPAYTDAYKTILHQVFEGARIVTGNDPSIDVMWSKVPESWLPPESDRGKGMT